jgi:hypothetical protein
MALATCVVASMLLAALRLTHSARITPPTHTVALALIRPTRLIRQARLLMLARHLNRLPITRRMLCLALRQLPFSPMNQARSLILETDSVRAITRALSSALIFLL